MDIFEAIREGLHDDDLIAIEEACRARHKILPLKVGDAVQVSDQCSPKYMQGIKGTVVEVTKKKKQGETVYVVKPNQSEVWGPLGSSKVAYCKPGTLEITLRNIQFPRSLLKKVASDE